MYIYFIHIYVICILLRTLKGRLELVVEVLLDLIIIVICRSIALYDVDFIGPSKLMPFYSVYIRDNHTELLELTSLLFFTLLCRPSRKILTSTGKLLFNCK